MTNANGAVQIETRVKHEFSISFQLVAGEQSINVGTLLDLIEELRNMEEDDWEFDEKWSELVENVQAHVAEEETDLLPQAEESELDLAECGAQMAERKETAIDEIGASSMAHAAKSRLGSRSKNSTKQADSRHP